MFVFIQAISSADWKLHLIEMELFTKYFLLQDKICYLRMVLLYGAEMASLESSNPGIFAEFITGNSKRTRRFPSALLGVIQRWNTSIELWWAARDHFEGERPSWNVKHSRSTQEEADTKIILHALDASTQGATQLSIYFPDPDVLVLTLRRYADLCSYSCFVPGTGISRRVTNLKSVSDALRPTWTAALPAFHALTGADVTGGSFSVKRKATC